ncbi:zinc finger protein 608 isoform X2 [Paramormyrops kingsleyae]|uniref:Zinc finger protein 608 n=1 Tax=Paramormyrops kingsleyae TaxID=1676925 RepID=A0A3B3R0T6_9TELE|nr:zinc finger protein 608 isoform X2 [Paramormyrops kingsleyae]
MSVIPIVEKNVDPTGVETYDSGDDWEIGVGNLIIDLDADLEKDRQKLEMNRLGNIKGSAKDYEGLGSSCANATSAVSDGLTFASIQPPVPLGNPSKDTGRGKVKRSKTSKDANKSASPSTTLYGIPELCGGGSQEAEGRSREGLVMNSSLGEAVSNPNISDATASCAKGKEEKNAKNQGRGLKRERDAIRARKEKQDAGQTSFGPLSGNLYGLGGKGSPCHCGDNGTGDIRKSGMDSAIMESAIVGKRTDDEIAAPAKKLKTDKVESMFTVPGSLMPVSQAPPSYAHLSPPISSPSEQLLVRTRSIGTNTREAGNGTDPGLLGPCQPGTTVNLEGIVWHETEEGVLVVNVTWRKRTYVGTLLDCTKHNWAPPRFCESPSSDFEMRGGRGRGKRIRLAIPNLPEAESSFSKVRGLPHKCRGGSVHGKGRRASLNLIGSCRIPPFFTVEEIKSSSIMSGKRKNKLPADLDLNLVSEDVKSGKRIRAKSRSAPSTPQGKSDTSFLDQGCSSPTLIDCPHPNCNKKYKHINGLRYHQTHAHQDLDRKLEFEEEGEARVSDCEESLSNITLDCPESTEGPLKTSPLFKLGTLGVPRNRRAPLSNDQHNTTSPKVRRNSGTREGAADDLSNLPIISNMTVLLENCLVTDRSSSTEMPKLEAEGLIEKKATCDKSKKANGKVDKCLSKSKATRPIAPAPPPPKLIAISTATFTSSNAGPVPHQSSPTAVAGHIATKSPLLKPIRPKSGIISESSLVTSTLVTGKDSRKKEKHRFKDRECKEGRSPKTDAKLLKTDLVKGKEFPVSLLKEHLSKQDGISGMSESQESRMASIRAEADKVYTFTDNAPSPSIGTSSRVDSAVLSNGDGANTKTNSPAYSDISDAAEDGGGDGRPEGARSKASLASETSSSKDNSSKGYLTAPPQQAVAKDALSPYYHGYDPYYLSGYLHPGQPNSSTFPKISVINDSSPQRDDAKEDSVEKEGSECLEGKKNDAANPNSQSQLQLAMMQTQTALAQSLYYGQYTRGLYMDQKLLMLSNNYRPAYEKFYDEPQMPDQKSAQELEQKEQIKGDANPGKTVSSSSASKSTDSVKSCCPKLGLTVVEEPAKAHISTTQQQGKVGLGIETDSQHLAKEATEIKLTMDSVKQNTVDPKLTYTHDSEAHSWYHPYPLKSMESQNLSEEVSGESKEREAAPGPATPAEPEHSEAKQQESLLECGEDRDKSDERELGGSAFGETTSGQGPAPAPASPQQAYVSYQQAYSYLQMCDASSSAYRVMSPALLQSYAGFHYPLYGKTTGREESEVAPGGRAISGKPACESVALELLQHKLPFHGQSSTPVERESPKRERTLERERDHTPFARHLHTHHHTHLGVGYPLIPGQYDHYQALGASGLSPAAVVSSQQVAAQTSAAGNDGKI